MSRRSYMALLPWMMFAFVARAGGQGATWAAMAALAGLVLVAASERRVDGVSGFTQASIALAAGLAAIAIAVGGQAFEPWARCAAALGLSAIAAASVGGVPFIEHYARELVPPGTVGTPRFRATTRAIARIWAVAFAWAAGSFLVAAIMDHPLAATMFNWVVPALVLLKASERAGRLWDLHFGEEPGGIYGLFEV